MKAIKPMPVADLLVKYFTLFFQFSFKKLLSAATISNNFKSFGF